MESQACWAVLRLGSLSFLQLWLTSRGNITPPSDEQSVSQTGNLQALHITSQAGKSTKWKTCKVSCTIWQAKLPENMNRKFFQLIQSLSFSPIHPQDNRMIGHIFYFILTVLQTMKVFKHSHSFRKHSLFNEIITTVSESAARWSLWLGRVLSVNAPMFTRYFLRGTALHLRSVKWATFDCYISQHRSWCVYQVMKVVLCHRTCQTTYFGFLFSLQVQLQQLHFASDPQGILQAVVCLWWRALVSHFNQLKIIWELGPSPAFVVLGSHLSSCAQETILAVSLSSDTRHFPGCLRVFQFHPVLKYQGKECSRSAGNKTPNILHHPLT